MFDQIKKALAYIQLAIGIIPMIIELVKAVEIPGNGPAKLAAVVELVKAAYSLIPEDVAKALGIDKLETFVTKVVNIIVSFLNSTGVFKT